MTGKHDNRALNNELSSCSDVLVAAQQLGQRHNISELARLLGKSQVILANKLNPDCDGNHLNIGEAVAITELADDNGILDAWAASRGKVLVDIPAGVTTDEELADLVMIVSESVAQVFSAYRDARRDGVIDRHERQEIGQCVRGAIRDLLSLDAEIGGQVRELNAGRG